MEVTASNHINKASPAGPPVALLPPGVGRPRVLITSLFFLWGTPTA